MTSSIDVAGGRVRFSRGLTRRTALAVGTAILALGTAPVLASAATSGPGETVWVVAQRLDPTTGVLLDTITTTIGLPGDQGARPEQTTTTDAAGTVVAVVKTTTYGTTVYLTDPAPNATGTGRWVINGAARYEDSGVTGYSFHLSAKESWGKGEIYNSSKSPGNHMAPYVASRVLHAASPWAPANPVVIGSSGAYSNGYATYTDTQTDRVNNKAAGSSNAPTGTIIESSDGSLQVMVAAA